MNRLLRKRTGGTVRTPISWFTAGTPKIVHVDRARTQAGRTAIIVRTPHGWARGTAVDIAGPAQIGQWEHRFYPKGPNSWIETLAAVTLTDPDFCLVVSGGGLDIDWGRVGRGLDDR